MVGSCYYRPLSGPLRSSAGGGGGEVVEPRRFGQFQGVEDLLLARGGRRALGDVALGGGQGDQVHPVELVGDVAAGVAGGVLDGPDQQQREPAQLDVAADAVLAVVEHRPQTQGALHVAPAALDREELFVGRGEVVGGQGDIGGAEQPLAVQVGLAFGGGGVDAQQPGLGPAQVATQPRLVLQRTDELRAPARGPRIRTVDQPLQVAGQVRPDGDEGMRAARFVVCHNPEQAERDAAVRANLTSHLERLIDGSDAWTASRRSEFVGSLKNKPGLRRYLRRTKSGLLRVDAAAAKRESHLDGKWLLRTSDVTLTPDDLAAAYKQLLSVERGWRDMKGSLGLRPVFQHREDRIRGHVQLCWLALLLIRVIENTTGDTWRNIAHELDRLHLSEP